MDTPAKFIKDYEAASAAHDLAAVKTMIAEEAVYFFSNKSAHVGKDAVIGAIAANFEAIDAEHYELTDVEWLVDTEEAAVCVYAFRWSGRIKGKPLTGSGRGTSVLKRVEDKWTVVHEHLSQGPFNAET